LERLNAAPPAAAPRHKATRRGRVTRVAGPAVLALALTGTVVAHKVSQDEVDGPRETPSAVAPVDLSVRTGQVSRGISRAVSRTAVRPLTTARQVVLRPTAVDHLYATAELNLRSAPRPDGALMRTVPMGTRLAVTGQTFHGWAEVLVRRDVPATGRGDNRTKAHTVTAVRWANADYLAESKPAPPEPEPEPATSSSSSSSSSSPDSSASSSTTASSGVSGAACPDGSSIESGLTSTAVGLYRAVCAAFPALATYGGYDAHGEHVDGRAIDFMITDSSLGQAVADYVLANAGTLGVRDIIWSQHIWTPEQASPGWRAMEDRGSPTATHYDHAHLAVY